MLKADPRSVINACSRSGNERDNLVRIPQDFPPWLNVSVWRKSSQWWVLNRRHAVVVSEDEETLSAFETKCFQVFASAAARERMIPSARSCYGDEHYFATALALRGEEAATTCSEGVTYVNWDSTYKTGHPMTYGTEELVRRHGFFTQKRDGITKSGADVCGGRKDPPKGWGAAESLEGVTCRARGAANDWGWGDDANSPKFHECLFMRKIAESLAPTMAGLAADILAPF